MKLLEGKTIIITGASSGIGYATAKLFAQHGANLVVAARREQMLDDLVRSIQGNEGQAIYLAGDVSDQQFNSDLVCAALEQFGQLDAAFNNAGTLGSPKPISQLELSDWLHTISTNLTSAFLAAKHQIPVMSENGGSIIFTSSFVGYTAGFPMQAAYAASKAGIIGLTKSLAAECGSNGIRVNALLPGGTETDMSKEFGDSPEIDEFVKSIHALKRIASPEEIAESALYLASDMSSFTTGSAMLVDGGVSINKA